MQDEDKWQGNERDGDKGQEKEQDKEQDKMSKAIFFDQKGKKWVFFDSY